MSFTKITVAALVAVLCISGFAAAQCTDGSLSNLDLTLNGVDPSSDPGHQITTSANGAIDLSIVDSTGASTGFILLAGSGISCASIPAGAILDQIDLGSPQLLLDGINSTLGALDFLATTPFTVGFALPVAFAGICGPAFQAVYIEPPFFFRTTDAGQICYQGTKVTTYSTGTLGDDDKVTHALDGVTPDIVFNGVSYSSLTISSNGVVAMVDGTTSWTPLMAQFFAGFVAGATVTPNPGVSLLWSDLMQFGTPNGVPSWDVIEDMVTGDVQVVARNQNFWSSADPAGDTSCTFTVNAGFNHDVVMDYSATIVGVTSADNILIGLTDGDSNVGTDVDLSTAGGWAGLVGGGSYISAGANDSVGELTAPNIPLGFTQIVAVDLGVSQWSILVL